MCLTMYKITVNTNVYPDVMHHCILTIFNNINNEIKETNVPLNLKVSSPLREWKHFQLHHSHNITYHSYKTLLDCINFNF